MKNLFYILVLFALSCQSSPTPSVEESDASTGLDRNDKVSVFDLFSEVKLIPLKTNEQSKLTFRMGSPDQALVHNGNFYFRDEKQQAIIVFDSKGNFLKKIGKKGRGPDEYFSINDMVINRFDGNIETLSAAEKTINIYDPQGEKLIEKIELPYDIPIMDAFAHLAPDEYILLSRAADVEIYFYSKKDKKVIKSDYNLPEWFNMNTPFSGRGNPFYVINDTVCFAQIYNGDVFSIPADSHKLVPRYEWGMGKAKFDISVLPDNEPLMYYIWLSKEISLDYAISFLVYAENQEYYFTRFKYKNKHKHLIYNKKTKERLLFEHFEEGGQCLAQWVDDEYMYAFASKPLLNLALDPSVLNEEDKAKYSNLQEDDNPVVIRYKFKKK